MRSRMCSPESPSPAGRLPTTWPATRQDVPVIDVSPVDGVLRYAEGIHIGYRAWHKAGVRPAYPFGFGLGYTTWGYDEVRLADVAGRRGAGERRPHQLRRPRGARGRAGLPVATGVCGGPASALAGRVPRWSRPPPGATGHGR